MSTHNIYFYGEIWKLCLNYHHIPTLCIAPWYCIFLPSMALLRAAHTGSLCTGSSWAPTGLFHGSLYANKLNASWKVYDNLVDKSSTIIGTESELRVQPLYDRLANSVNEFHLAVSQLSCLMTKPTKWYVCPAKTQISLGIRPVWSESSLSTWRKLVPLASYWAHNGDSDQTGRMPRLIWVFAGCTVILLVLSWGCSVKFSCIFTKPATIKLLYFIGSM